MKFRTFAFAAALVVSVLPVVPASACCGVVGEDGYTRLTWNGTDGSISVWKTDSNLNTVASHNYGPILGWWHVSSAMIGNNYYVLWGNTSGEAAIWMLDTNLNYVTGANYGPEANWIPEGLGVDGKGNLRLFWRTTEDQVVAWVIDAGLGIVGSSNLGGPYFGWVF